MSKFIGLLIFMIGDIIFTYINVTKVAKSMGVKKAMKYELNPLVRLLWKFFGMKLGSIIFMIFAGYLFYLMYINFGLVDYVWGYFCGMYSVIYLFHFNAIASSMESKEGKGDD